MIPLQKRLRLLSDSSSLDGSPHPVATYQAFKSVAENARIPAIRPTTFALSSSENWRLSEQVDYWRKKAQSLERELHKEVRTARERPFGNDTPSSK